MFKVSAETLQSFEERKLQRHNQKLSSWLATRKVGWTKLSAKAQTNFLDENDARAKAAGMGSEKARAMLAYCFLMSGDWKAFGARGDVQEALAHERTHEFGKTRRLHAIAYDVKNGTHHATERPKADPTFEMKKKNKGAEARA